MNKMKKPMLLSNDEFDLKQLDYSNMYISIKRDGVRAETTNAGIKNRSLKILRNSKMQEYFREVFEALPEDVTLEAEIYADGIPCRKMAGVCNSLDKDIPKGTKLYIFGIYDETADFEERMGLLHRVEDLYLSGDRYSIVFQEKIYSEFQARAFYKGALALGFEGAVMMDGSKKYKEGRVTINQHIGFKLKPHKEIDLKIIGVTERFLNTNESQTNELGDSFKRDTVDAKESTGIAATFICEYKGLETKVTITGEEDSRREIWKNQEKYLGAYAVVKAMDYGEKDRLRHPRLVSIKLQVEK